jgi:hypothetical protein
MLTEGLFPSAVPSYAGRIQRILIFRRLCMRKEKASERGGRGKREKGAGLARGPTNERDAVDG